MYHFYIQQGEHCWQFIARNMAEAIQLWREKAVYTFEAQDKVQGRPDKVRFIK